MRHRCNRSVENSIKKRLTCRQVRNVAGFRTYGTELLIVWLFYRPLTPMGFCIFKQKTFNTNL